MMLKPYSGDLYRGEDEAPEAREADASSTYMQGHFAVFDQWTEIHSYYEGDFVERIAPGAFKRSINTHRSSIVCQFEHGFDRHVGELPLGPFDELREDDYGCFYGVPLLDTDYNRDRILPLLQGRTMDGETHGSQLGASFKFRAMSDEWVEEPKRSDHNPDGLPERTITEARLFEGGPVIFGAYVGATSGIRSLSLTDHFEERAREGRSRVLRSTPPGPATGEEHPTGPASSHPEGSRAHRPVQLVSTSLHIARGRLRPLEPS